MTHTPTKKDLIYNKLLAISGFMENAKTRIDKAHYVKAKEYLAHAQEDAEKGMELIRSIVDERDLWQE